VGVGKTIEAGMIARELIDRGLIRRILVLCPAHLCDQWSQELSEKFGFRPAVVQPSNLGWLEREHAMRQPASFLEASGSRWVLLLYGEGPNPENREWQEGPPNVLVLSLRSFLEDVRTRAFPELVRDLRNRRVYGAIR
jgi:SNF2 family DNA or RNA helicase